MTYFSRAFSILLGALLLLGISGAEAAPLKWLISATFTDGGTLSGSLVYDADTRTYSDISLTTSGGAVGNAGLNKTYSFVCTSSCPSAPSALSAVFYAAAPAGDLTGQPALSFDFSFLGPLGTTSPAYFVGENLTCGNSDCSGRSGADRVAGTVTAVLAPPVPAPTGWRLAIFGLLLAGLAGRHLKREATGSR